MPCCVIAGLGVLLCVGVYMGALPGFRVVGLGLLVRGVGGFLGGVGRFLACL